MSDLNGFGSYSSESDLCPNCGAMKMFSALVCPSCGMDYTEAARQRAAKAGDTPQAEPVKTKTEYPGGFDPNAAFKKFKNSLEEKDSATVTEEAKTEAESKPVVVEEKPEVYDPIAKKLSEMNAQNSAMYGERVYRVNTGETDSTAQTSGSAGAGSYGISGAGTGSAVNSRYGGAVWQSGSSPNTPQNQFSSTQKQFSTEVSNRYESYRSGMDNSGAPNSQYASPYSRGSYDAIPTEKPSTFKKILPLLIALVIIAVGAYVIFHINSLKANDKGVKYDDCKDGIISEHVTDGKLTVSYSNEWAEMRIEDIGAYTDRYSYMSGNAIASRMGLSANNTSGIDLEFFYMEGTGIGILVFNVETGWFGKSEEDFLAENEIGMDLFQGFSNYVAEPDMLLGDCVYKCRSIDIQQGTLKLKCYFCVRSVGNRMVSVIFYDNPNNSQLGRMKAMFKKY